MFKTALLSILGIVVTYIPGPCYAAKSMSTYVLEAVEFLDKNYGQQGYGNFALTHDLQFGDNGTLAAQQPPKTMCVAAQLEVLVQALNFYYQDTKDISPFHFIPKERWERLRPIDLRGQIWEVANSNSHGAGDALANFGMGKRVSFRELIPGAFLDFNRTNKHGHAVIFLGYIDKNGDPLPSFSGNVAGFKYFSSNGAPDAPASGFGYRWAFFSTTSCPKLSGGRHHDCGIIDNDNSNLLVGGILSSPSDWDRSKMLKQISRFNEGKTNPSLLIEGGFDSTYFSGVGVDE
jgi:hypothetical protein